MYSVRFSTCKMTSWISGMGCAPSSLLCPKHPSKVNFCFPVPLRTGDGELEGLDSVRGWQHLPRKCIFQWPRHALLYGSSWSICCWVLVQELTACLLRTFCMQVMDINPKDRVLTLTSGGCNALNLLLHGAGEVVSVDCNPAQVSTINWWGFCFTYQVNEISAKEEEEFSSSPSKCHECRPASRAALPSPPGLNSQRMSVSSRSTMIARQEEPVITSLRAGCFVLLSSGLDFSGLPH